MRFLTKVKAKTEDITPGTDKPKPQTDRLVFFEDWLKTVKSVFPNLRMRFPSPPTYIWNPKDEKAPLDPSSIKDQLKVRLPKLVWETEFSDATDRSYVDFEDGSKAELAIGLDANHLTITYEKGTKDEVFV